MLSSLSIKNYALIENLRVDFQDKLSIITGETGAGKSILLGGLSLVLGKRADASLVSNKEKKCIIEAEFAIDAYGLQYFFKEEDLDYEPLTTIRREILTNGKSRAFINDTPTTLSTLTALSEKLIDIHSQHETLQLANSDFQFQIIDALAGNDKLLKSYKSNLEQYKELIKSLDLILLDQHRSKEEFDYNSFLLNELIEAGLKENEQSELEEKLEKLEHVEDIKSNLSEVIEISEDEQIGLKILLSRVKGNMDRIASFARSYKNLSERIDSLYIELNDIVDEFESENENLEYDPSGIESLNERLQLIYSLQTKHSVNSINDLMVKRVSLESKIKKIDDQDEIIRSKKEEIEKTKQKMEGLALEIHQRRAKAIPVFTDQLERALSKLEMKNTKFSIDLVPVKHFLNHGKDQLNFLISANKGKSFEQLKKVASGGEMSRIMLAVKSILSKYTKLPAIIFDEIDTGVSGEVSNKVGEVMKEMSANMQVITITHLPQIASVGNQHYKVFKEENADTVYSNIKLLTESERVKELAEMLGGKKVSKTAIEHAKQLLN